MTMTTMERTDEILERAARRYRGIIERLCTSRPRGYILAANGETLPFHRTAVMGRTGPHAWRPAVEQAVLFDRELRSRGPWAIKLRRLESRHRLPADDA
jgi:hypothetical protein